MDAARLTPSGVESRRSRNRSAMKLMGWRGVPRSNMQMIQKSGGDQRQDRDAREDPEISPQKDLAGVDDHVLDHLALGMRIDLERVSVQRPVHQRLFVPLLDVERLRRPPAK